MAEIISNTTSFSEQVEEIRMGQYSLLLCPIPVQSVVSFGGSFLSHPDFGSEEQLLQDITVSLLDKGTVKRNRFEVAEILEDRGAELHFHSTGLRVGFTGKVLSEHFSDVIEILSEQLFDPLFDPEEFEKSKAQLLASVHRSMENTGMQASGALSRRIYSPSHPNYSPEPEYELKKLNTYSVESVRNYHKSHFGTNDLIITVVGDFDREVIKRVIEAQFNTWTAHLSEPRYDVDARSTTPGRSSVPMPEKTNVDVRMGHALPVKRQDPDFIPLYIGNYVLGGNFSARLMTRVRDEMGLTYGISSGLSGISTQYQGHWQVAVTLSQENLNRGIEATLAEVSRFVEGGVTGDELETVKTTISGSFKVGLATTSGVAASLLHNAERGFDPGYLDRFPLEVLRTPLDAVNDAIEHHFDTDLLQFALAGMIEE